MNNEQTALKEIIKRLRDKYVKDPRIPEITTYFDINRGYCEEIAYRTFEEYEKLVYTGAEVLGTENFYVEDYEPGYEEFDWELLKSHWPREYERNYKNPDCALEVYKGACHVWVYLDGKHYDSEAPEGVDNFFELPFFRRYEVQYLRERGVEAEDVRTQDVGPVPECPVKNHGKTDERMMGW